MSAERCAPQVPSGGLQRWLPSWLLILLALGSAGGMEAEISSSQGLSVELSAPTQRVLKQLSDGAVQWQKAFLQEDRTSAEAEQRNLLALAASVGFERLPDLNNAALARAVEAAEQRDFPRARWALESAEAFDPGRPGTAFAEAQIHRYQGEYIAAITDSVRGYARLFALPVDLDLWQANLVLWLFYSFIGAGGFFVLLLLGTRGREVALDLADSLGQRMPRPLAWLLVLVLLLGPLALPFGVTWLLLVWVVLLWAYCSLSERLVLIFVLLLVGSVPFLLPAQRQQVALALSPPVRAVTAVKESRLYGRLFSDFSVLGRVQGENPAVHHLLADLHRRLGQWELARSSYLDLVEREPKNAPALINLGIYFYNQEDFGRAATYFRKATEADPESAVAYFNLSQAFSSEYLYDDSRRALQQAQQLKSKEVGQWIQEAVAVEVRPEDGGVARLAEIKTALGSEHGGTDSGVKGRVLRHGLTLFVAVGVLLMAAALYLARRGGGLSTPSSGPRNRADTGDLLLRVLVPGLPSARDGSGIVAYLAWVPPVALLLLPFSSTWGYAIPWGFEPGGMVTKLAATVGLVVFLLLRLVQQNRGS